MSERLKRLRKQVENFRILARDYAQWRSIRDWSCNDAEGEPIPWYTYPAIEYLNHLDLSMLSVFEFGSGHSTLWWSERARYVRSVEDNAEWYEKIKPKLGQPPNNIASYTLHIEKRDYVASLQEQFDIVIIDGKHRPECLSQFLDVSPESVMLIFDNSDWFPETIERARQNLGWVEMDFHGFGPINSYTWTTSLFINPKKLKSLVYNKNLNSISPIHKSLETIDEADEALHR